MSRSLLVIGHFALPFTLLLSQDVKKGPWLARVALFILVMRLVDMIWLVAPTFQHARRRRAGFPIHWMDLAIPGLAGIWLFFFTRSFATAADAAQRSIPQGGVRA